MECRSTALGILLCTAAFGSAALSMGSSRGSAVIGQPLQLSFDIGLDPGVEALAACVQAELYYGETRIDPSRFRVIATPGAAASQANVQVLSSVAVNEPVVSVVLRAGCGGQALSRRYVLLASSPTLLPGPLPEVESSSAARSSPPSQVAGPSQRPATPVSPGSPRRDGATALPPAARSAEPPVRVAPTPRKPVPPPSVSRRTAEGRPRLELQSPAEWLEEMQLPLRISTAMASPVAVTPEQRAAMAAAWRHLNGETTAAVDPVAGSADDPRRLTTLELQNKALRDSLARQQARESELQSRLDDAQREGEWLRILGWASLAALVLVAASAARWAYRRRKVSRAWWNSHEGPASPNVETIDPHQSDLDFVDTQPSAWQPSIFPRPDLDNGPAGDAHRPYVPRRPVSMATEAAIGRTEALATAAVPAPVPPVFMGTGPGMDDAPALHVGSASPAVAVSGSAVELQTLSSDVLLDVRQNAEFLISLGQYEQAIETLQQYIDSHAGASPSAYLDLLQIFHTLSLTDRYRQLRETFGAQFNAAVPVFAAFLKPARDLESYTAVVDDIVRAWTRADAVRVIEARLFRQSASSQDAPFELEAFRDLLLLHEIARSVGADGAQALPEESPPSGADVPMPLFQLADSEDAEADAVAQTTPAQEYLPVFPLPETFPPPVGSRPATDEDARPPLDFSSLEPFVSPTQEKHQADATHLWEPVLDKSDRDGASAQVDDLPAPARKHKGNLIDFDVFDLDVREPRRPQKD